MNYIYGRLNWTRDLHFASDCIFGAHEGSFGESLRRLKALVRAKSKDLKQAHVLHSQCSQCYADRSRSSWCYGDDAGGLLGWLNSLERKHRRGATQPYKKYGAIMVLRDFHQFVDPTTAIF
jgi:hypothetical protein